MTQELPGSLPTCFLVAGKGGEGIREHSGPRDGLHVFVAPGVRDPAFTSKLGKSLCLSEPQLSHM